ncbi:kinesin-like protein KIN-10B isoform X1 [Sorghum bicolor]|uniref:kinesin-like protein KIN-10B isoform X1 n=1 Tax=Sorghum bicolor TaxID=4558 RepID=UPI000B4251A5|nr:kinesin-like protein KIN-10B isoform X1 [Sorghum bicolor]|eukprot:XP_021302864.1 kinesin-like protein KIN-10B isoform X1 [Sorghum bicolor]
MEEAAAAAAAATAAPSPCPRTAPVRVVARICPGGGPSGSFHVAARVPDPANSSSASVSFIPVSKEAAPSGSMTPHKQREYKLDWCYLNQDSDTHIFQNEVKHLVDNIFSGDGRNHACVITCGSTAKTNLVMGFEDHPGLLIMAMERILDCAKPIGATIRVSSYQVLQDNHVFDLLEPKDSEVFVREDANGRTHLKGLSKVGINSIQEFQNLCYGSDKLQNPTIASNQTSGHRGFIIFISRFDQNGRQRSVANMHFLELAGYNNNKQKSQGGGFAQPNSKKSLYAVMDVVQALNSHQSFIPYRKSKVTHILQDSLCKTSDALLIACLDEVSCQDVVSTLSLASRSSQVVNDQCYNLSLSTKDCLKSNVNLSINTKNLSRSLLPSTQQRSSIVEKSDKTQFNNSAVKAARALNANKRSETSTHSVKKTSTQSASISLKHSAAKSILRGRNLFFPTANSSKEDMKNLVTTAIVRPKEVETSSGMEIQALPPIEEKCDDTKNSVISSKMEKVEPCSMREIVLSDMKEEGHSSSTENFVADSSMTYPSTAADKSVEKNPTNVIQSSPKISDQLREISNSLKLLSTMPSSIKTDIVRAKPFDIVEAEPKTPEIHLKVRHVEDLQESGFKQKSLAKECLSFINSASKEQLKSLKGIGEKRANFILELREESPEPLKEIDDLRSIVGMNKKEINKMVSKMVLESKMD